MATIGALTATYVCPRACVENVSLYTLWMGFTAHRRTLTHVDLWRRKSPYRTSVCGMRRCTAPYARLTQGTQGPKHASNLRHVRSCDKFQPCHWPLLEYFAFIALHALRCLLLEIALNTGSVVLEGTATRHDGVLSLRVPPLRIQHLGPFYGASVYSCSL